MIDDFCVFDPLSGSHVIYWLEKESKFLALGTNLST